MADVIHPDRVHVVIDEPLEANRSELVRLLEDLSWVHTMADATDERVRTLGRLRTDELRAKVRVHVVTDRETFQRALLSVSSDGDSSLLLCDVELRSDRADASLDSAGRDEWGRVQHAASRLDMRIYPGAEELVKHPYSACGMAIAGTHQVTKPHGARRLSVLATSYHEALEELGFAVAGPLNGYTLKRTLFRALYCWYADKFGQYAAALRPSVARSWFSDRGKEADILNAHLFPSKPEDRKKATGRLRWYLRTHVCDSKGADLAWIDETTAPAVFEALKGVAGTCNAVTGNGSHALSGPGLALLALCVTARLCPADRQPVVAFRWVAKKPPTSERYPAVHPATLGPHEAESAVNALLEAIEAVAQGNNDGGFVVDEVTVVYDGIGLRLCCPVSDLADALARNSGGSAARRIRTAQDACKGVLAVEVDSAATTVWLRAAGTGA